MPLRKWDAKTKAMIVLEGLKGKPVAELCAEHQISQAQYDQWREQFLAHVPQASLARENVRLKTLVGELTLELKKRRGVRMSRQSSPLVAHRNEGLLQHIGELKAEPPFWGYRRIWAYLHFVERQPVNKKRVRRLMREHSLPVPPVTRRVRNLERTESRKRVIRPKKSLSR